MPRYTKLMPNNLQPNAAHAHQKGKRKRLGLGIVKKTGAAVLAIGVLLAPSMANTLGTPEQLHERKLMIAIDDGTEDGQLFVEMDDSDWAASRDDSPLPVERIHDPDDVVIVSSGAIDDKTKDCIRLILSSSGHAGKVVFMDHREASESLSGIYDAAGANEPHRTKVISKEISATN